MSDYQLPHETIPYLHYADETTEQIRRFLEVYQPEAAQHLIQGAVRELAKRVAREVSSVYIDRMVKDAEAASHTMLEATLAGIQLAKQERESDGKEPL